ncbi:MAG: hypothetical protein ABR915_00075 [Thermoguttaceae bacterium]
MFRNLHPLAVGSLLGLLAAAVVCAAADRPAPSQLEIFKEPGDPAAAWKKASEGQDAAARAALLRAIDAATLRKWRGLLEYVYAQDPDPQVYTAAVDRWIELAGSKTRPMDFWVAQVRNDFDRCYAGAEKLVAARKNNPAYRSNLAEFLYGLLDELDYPQPPPGGKVKLTLKGGPRGRPRQVELGEADAAQMRAHYARLLELLNGVVPSGVKPSPEAPKQLAQWWEEHGGKKIWAEHRRQQYKAAGAAAFLKSPNPARVLSAGCLGTKGTEWLVGGGIQPDDTIVTVGTSLGPSLDFAGVKTLVLGKDGPAPGEPEPYKGDPRQKQWRWSHAQGTPFVLRLDGGLKSIRSATRLPWAAGGVTGVALDAAGNIYVTGPRREGFAGLAAEALPPPPAPAAPATPAAKPWPPSDHPDRFEATYLLKLSPDASRLLWARTVEGAGIRPPEVSLLADGRIAWIASDLRILDADGKQQGRIELGPKLDGRSGVDPRNGAVFRGGEHQWNTAQEPYRCPYIFASRPDGWRLTLWHFDGPFVGAATGNVADSGINRVRIDPQGDLLVAGWAHGGNTILNHEPLDCLKPIAKKGFGNPSSSGAGAVGYLFRVSAKDWSVSARTSQASVAFTDVQQAVDGSMLLIGDIYWGFTQTSNNIATADPAGQYVMVCDRDFTKLRFSSAMNSAGADVLVGDSENRLGWGMASGKLHGRPVALFFSGAAEKADVWGSTATPPESEPVQKGFAGGRLDGYLMILDLSSQSPEVNKP